MKTEKSEKTGILNGIICFVMALIVMSGCGVVYFLCRTGPDASNVGEACGIIAFFLGGGLLAVGVKSFGFSWNDWD